MLMTPKQHDSRVFTLITLWDLVSIVFKPRNEHNPCWGLFQTSESIWEVIKETGRKGPEKRQWEAQAWPPNIATLSSARRFTWINRASLALIRVVRAGPCRKDEGRWGSGIIIVCRYPRRQASISTGHKKEQKKNRKGNKFILKQEALKLPIRKPNIISTLVMPNLFGLVLPCFCLFLWQSVENHPRGNKTGWHMYTHEN